MSNFIIELLICLPTPTLLDTHWADIFCHIHMICHTISADIVWQIIICENIIHYITADQIYYLPVCRDCSMELFFTNQKILMHSANHKKILTVFRNLLFHLKIPASFAIKSNNLYYLQRHY